MSQDRHGLALSTACADAAAGYDRAIASLLNLRLDAPAHLARALDADPEFALAHCLKGYFVMLLYKQAAVPGAAVAAGAALRLSEQATARERSHAAALEAWVAGDVDRTLAIWEEILGRHPTDVLALRLAHHVYFWRGQPRAMQASVERVTPKWGRDLPHFGALLGCRAFASEECGEFLAAERAGRAAVEIDPADLWATHAVTHVMEMQGRHDEGIAWLDQMQGHWADANHFLHHLWWHRALFHLERREFDMVLDLYDRRFRNLASPLNKVHSDFHTDIQNAASMLFRLERHGVPVGDRWTEIADKAESRVGDFLSTFTLPHWMMALAATGRHAAARHMLAAMRDVEPRAGTVAAVVASIAAPVSEAILAYWRHEYSRALDLMRPVLDRRHLLGGSHAQQDVLEQLFIEAAVRANRFDDIRLALQRTAATRPTSPERRIGYADAAIAAGTSRFSH